jgi:hypothetical protein
MIVALSRLRWRSRFEARSARSPAHFCFASICLRCWATSLQFRTKGFITCASWHACIAVAYTNVVYRTGATPGDRESDACNFQRWSFLLVALRHLR